MDAETAAKKILEEYGPKACVIDEPCKIHAMRPGRAGAQPDWIDILRYTNIYLIRMTYTLILFLMK